ncbi:hypothetical protein [Phyllobacterium brassicacearum]|nr:hypothetical protein [Phyllobacterium brassicacearum]
MTINGQKIGAAAVSRRAHALQEMIRVQIGLLSFYQHRLEQDMHLITELVASGKYHNAFGVLDDFYRDAVAEYTNEAHRLASEGCRITSDVVKRAICDVEASIRDLAV